MPCGCGTSSLEFPRTIWEYQPQPASKQTHPGVYKLRTTLTDWAVSSE